MAKYENWQPIDNKKMKATARRVQAKLHSALGSMYSDPDDAAMCLADADELFGMALACMGVATSVLFMAHGESPELPIAETEDLVADAFTDLVRRFPKFRHMEGNVSELN